MRKKVAMVAACPFPANRGTPSRILRMAESLAELNYDVHVVTYHLGDKIPTKGIKIHRFPRIPTYSKMSAGPAYQKPLLDLLLFLKLLKIVKKEKITLIHAHHYEGAFVGWLVKKIFPHLTLVYDAHGSLSEEMGQFKFMSKYKWMRKFWYLIERFINTHNDFVIAVSEELANIINKQGVPHNNIAIVPTGVNINFFKKANIKNIRNQYGVYDSPLIVYTGNLSSIQGIEYLLKVFVKVVEKMKNAKLMIVGNSNITKYKNLSKSLNLGNSVIFAGEKEFKEIPSFLVAADILASPRTNCPGIPQKLSNYMAVGKPIVSFEGSAKTIKNKINGIIVKDGDIEGFAEAIVNLLNDEKTRKRLGGNARKWAEKSLEWSILSKKIDTIYKNLNNKKEKE